MGKYTAKVLDALGKKPEDDGSSCEFIVDAVDAVVRAGYIEDIQEHVKESVERYVDRRFNSGQFRSDLKEGEWCCRTLQTELKNRYPSTDEKERPSEVLFFAVSMTYCPFCGARF